MRVETPPSVFEEIVGSIARIGYQRHAETIINYVRDNLAHIEKTIKDLPVLSDEKQASGIVISAGPSVHRRKSIQRILEANYQGTIVAVDGAYVACLKAGLIPDFVLTLDPHPTRVVRWFGDHDFEKHTEHDDYFLRQDLDVAFRENTLRQNQQHIALVNQYGARTKAIVASTAPQNVVRRLKEAGFEMYWWNPLMDNPRKPESLTRKVYEINKLPCMSTGGNVGTAAWVFARAILKLRRIGLVGMDYGYYQQTPYEKTQTYYELKAHLRDDEERLKQCFVRFEFPLTKETFYTDPTYFWYRKNFLGLLKSARGQTFNCTEAGTLFSDDVPCVYLDEFLKG